MNENERYKGNVNEMTFSKSENKDEFNGILKYLLNKSNNQIEEEIKITASSVSDSSIPQNVVLFEEKNKKFHTSNDPAKNSWICFDFKESSVVLTDYIIKSYPNGANTNHPKSWVIEGSNDDKLIIKTRNKFIINQ